MEIGTPPKRPRAKKVPSLAHVASLVAGRTNKDVTGEALRAAAARGDDAEVVRLFHLEAADLNAPHARSGDTPAHTAARAGRVSTLRLLRRLGADVGMLNGEGRTPLRHAAREAHDAAVRALVLELGADATARLAPAATENATRRDRSPGTSAGGKAGKKRARSEAPQKWSAARACSNARGSQALHAAAEKGRASTVRLLCSPEMGADPNAKTAKGYSALHLASGLGHLEAVRALLEHGADANAAASDRAGGREPGTEAGFNTGGGVTPCRLAAQRGHDQVLRLLVRGGGARVDLADWDGRTPLHAAAQAGLANTVRLLVRDLGADPQVANRHGFTAAHFAAASGHLVALQELAMEGADLEARAKTGNTPLSFATSRGKADVAAAIQEILAVRALARAGDVPALQREICGPGGDGKGASQSNPPFHQSGPGGAVKFLAQWLPALPAGPPRARLGAWAAGCLADAKACFEALHCHAKQRNRKTLLGRVFHDGVPHLGLLVESFLVHPNPETRGLLLEIHARCPYETPPNEK